MSACPERGGAKENKKAGKEKHFSTLCSIGACTGLFVICWFALHQHLVPAEGIPVELCHSFRSCAGCAQRPLVEGLMLFDSQNRVPDAPPPRLKPILSLGLRLQQIPGLIPTKLLLWGKEKCQKEKPWYK